MCVRILSFLLASVLAVSSAFAGPYNLEPSKDPIIEMSMKSMLDQFLSEMTKENPELSKEEAIELIKPIQTQLYKDMEEVKKSFSDMSTAQMREILHEMYFALTAQLKNWGKTGEELTKEESLLLLRQLASLYMIMASVRSTYGLEQISSLGTMVAGTAVVGIASGDFTQYAMGVAIAAYGLIYGVVSSKVNTNEQYGQEPNPIAKFIRSLRTKLPIFENAFNRQYFRNTVDYVRTSLYTADTNLKYNMSEDAPRIGMWARNELIRPFDEFESDREFLGVVARYYLEFLRRVSSVTLEELTKELSCNSILLETTTGQQSSK